MKNVVIKCALLLIFALSTSACQTTRPASVAGECGVFKNPGRAVQGKTRQDQRDIDGGWLEPGFASCGWARPTR